MKRVAVVLVILAIMMSLVALPTGFAAESEKRYGDWEYIENGTTISITRYTGNETVVAIPDKIAGKEVTSIGDDAFRRCSNLTSVTIPNSVWAIGSYAFSDCSNLTSVTIPNSVIYIRAGAFSGCSNLTSVTIPNSVKYILDSAFSNCSSLTSITIPSSVTDIDNWVFSDCSSLTNITIPNSVGHIGERAFSGCVNLTSVTIPNSVTIISDSAFSHCSGLANIAIPNSVEYIGKYAFVNCDSLTSVTIPYSVAVIGEHAFSTCNNLTSIFVDDSSPYYASIDGVLYSRDYTKLINYPPSKTGTSITIPNSVTAIGGGAFAGCKSHTNISIPNSVTAIGSWAFAFCHNLTRITIPNSVTSIGYAAFALCENLHDIYFLSTVPPTVGDGAFDRVAPGARAIVPYGATAYGPEGSTWYGLIVTYQKPTASPTSSTVLVNGQKVTFDSYNINGSNYFKLRDLAYALSGTTKRFSVDWNESANAITMTSGKPYVAVGGEMGAKGTSAKTATPTNSKILLNGKEAQFTAYKIDGNNYFKLRDIGAAFGFGVVWDGTRNTIVIDTSKGYTPE